MRLSRRSNNLMRLGVGVTLLFIYVPLFIVALYAFNGGITLKWPPEHLTTHWFGVAVNDPGVKDAVLTTAKVGLASTAIALLLGTLASLAVARHRFFGRETISFLVILPIALPGIVVVYNNVIARLRRVSGSLEEASADLGADPWQTFRFVTLPNMQTALVAGALLAFALSFDEIIVTLFTIGAGQETLPIWIYSNFFRPNQIPVVNVVAVLALLISIVPVYLAYRLTREEGGATGRGAAPETTSGIAATRGAL